MSKGTLANQLLGKLVCPKPEYGPIDDPNMPNYKIWAALKPNLSNEMLATIDAAWIENRAVMVGVHDVHGSTAVLHLSLINLWRGDGLKP